MARTVKVPVLGQSVEEVRIVQWFKHVGDPVEVGDPLGEIETDKTNMEFASTEAGVILSILAPVDTYVRVEAPVVLVGEPGESAEAPVVATPVVAAPQTAPVVTAAVPTAAPVATGTSLDASPRARRLADEYGVTLRDLAGKGTGPNGRIIERDIEAARVELEQVAQAALAASAAPASLTKASPLAQAIAADSGVDLAGVAGSGSGGKITADDVRANISPVIGGQGGANTLTLTGLRKRVADNLSKSVREKPHVTLNLSVDMTEANRLRKLLLPELEKSDNIRISPTDLIVKACAKTLLEHPMVNAHISGDTITLFTEAHIGLAVSLGDDGLIVPVIHQAQSKGLAQLAKDRVDLAARARSGKLTSTEVTGGTFTVTNLGNYGIESFNPIIPPPQVAILGVCAIVDTVVAVGGQPAVRPMMGLSLSFDHRAIDGAPASAFLARVKALLEQPYLLMA